MIYKPTFTSLGGPILSLFKTKKPFSGGKSPGLGYADALSLHLDFHLFKDLFFWIDTWERIFYTTYLDLNIPICSMYGIFTNIYPKNHPNVGKYSIHGASGIVWKLDLKIGQWKSQLHLYDPPTLVQQLLDCRKNHMLRLMTYVAHIPIWYFVIPITGYITYHPKKSRTEPSR